MKEFKFILQYPTPLEDEDLKDLNEEGIEAQKIPWIEDKEN